MIPVSIIYSTARKDPRIEWFLAALAKQAGDDLRDAQLIIVDFWAEGLKAEDNWSDAEAAERRAKFRALSPVEDTIVTPVMPNVWQGRYRLTRENWFAASAVRNTGICLAKHDTLVFVDDLSCPTKTWWPAVKEAVASGGIVAGSYRKVSNLRCEKGEIVSFDNCEDGHDNRFGAGSDDGPVPCGGNWLYGCNLVGPTEAFLEINGYPQICDSLGFEDVICGIQLEKKGWAFTYDRRMQTIEDRDLHFVGPVMRRSDYGVSPNDKSHALLKMAQQGDGYHPGYFDAGGIRELRRRVLSGEPFPICQIPDREWFTGKLLSEL
jgi:hypothetical protein